MKKTVKLHYDVVAFTAPTGRGTYRGHRHRVVVPYDEKNDVFTTRERDDFGRLLDFRTRRDCTTMRQVRRLLNRAQRDIPGGAVVVVRIGNGGRQKGKRHSLRVFHLRG